jgi:hypothetical protein
MQEMKFGPDRLVVGKDGLPVLEPGYSEIAGVRFYPERLVAGPYGQPVVEPGRVEIVEAVPPRYSGRRYRRIP